jgi:3-dehydroquinate dehydratase II
LATREIKNCILRAHVAIVDKIQEARGHVDAIIINPGGFTHTSVAIRDALLGVAIPFIELHVSNVHAREPWRHHSYFSDKVTTASRLTGRMLKTLQARAIICGMGTFGYKAAIEHIATSWEALEKP